MLIVLSAMLTAAGVLVSGGRAANAAALQWERVITGIAEPAVNSIHISGDGEIFVGTDRAVYRYDEAIGRSEPFMAFPSSVTAVNDIVAATGDGTGADAVRIYAATDSGLWARGLLAEGAGRGERIFDPSGEDARRCYAVLVTDTAIFAGTGDGLYVRSLAGVEWKKFEGDLGSRSVRGLARAGRFLFAVTSGAVYRLSAADSLDGRGDAKQVFSVAPEIRADDDPGLAEGDEADDAARPAIRDIAAVPGGDEVVLVTNRGLYVGVNQGTQWERLSNKGLPSPELNAVAIFSLNMGRAADPDTPPGASGINIFAATQKGVFYLAGSTVRDASSVWRPVYQGLATSGVRDIAASEGPRVYAAADQGLYALRTVAVESAGSSSGTAGPVVTGLSAAPGVPPGMMVPSALSGVGMNYAEVEEEFSHEPTIQDVQRWAIDYAEVRADKIRRWRKQARLKALMPDLSMGLNRAGTDRYHWDTGQSPDVLVEGDEYLDWDVSLSWDFADMVWSTDQTSIDSRSKLMVELREDILDEVTRLYFERRRVQIEVLAASTGALPFPGEFLEKEMRIAELTALIDGLTGGEFSRRIGRVPDTRRENWS